MPRQLTEMDQKPVILPRDISPKAYHWEIDPATDKHVLVPGYPPTHTGPKPIPSADPVEQESMELQLAEFAAKLEEAYKQAQAERELQPLPPGLIGVEAITQTQETQT